MLSLPDGVGMPRDKTDWFIVLSILIALGVCCVMMAV